MIKKITPLVSTLICTYNAEKFIENTIDSVQKQTYKNQEILIRDDGSSDDTIVVLEKIASKDKRIQIFTSKELGKKLGPYGGLNFLMDYSKGEYIAIQDHDDIRHSTKIKKQIDFLEKNKKYIGSGTGALMYYAKQGIGFYVDSLKEQNKSKVLHTSLVFRNKGFRYKTDIETQVDGYFMEMILSKGKNVLKIIPEIFSKLRYIIGLLHGIDLHIQPKMHNSNVQFCNIKFDNVFFNYNQKQVIQNLSFTIEPNECIS
ncbi:MAG TPA: glycosyltransferase, partial [Candidatus Absconditabacterales bacterium]|nr:glycosyltransferase [Candidatus Absconditabacterales bacterium]